MIDGHSIVYRAYFALIRNPLRNSRGENTSAVFGFANSLRKLMDQLKPDGAAVVFDAPGKSFRHDLFEDYKVRRARMPDELVNQLPVVKELVTAFGIRQLEIPGVEADDVLGTLARRLSHEGERVFIVTSDKDLLQMVDNCVQVYDPFKEIVYDRDKVIERFGVGPERVADLLALSGDSSDDIPGVPGIGPKRATEILLKFDTLEAAIEGEPRVRPHAEIARQSRALTAIKLDVPLPAQAEDLRIEPRDETALVKLYRQMGFSSLLRELVDEQPVSIAVSGADRFDAIAGKPVVGVVLGLDACWIAAESSEAVKLTPQDPRLRDQILLNPDVLKVGFDLKPELKLLAIGIRPAPIADVMIAGWLLDPNQRRRWS